MVLDNAGTLEPIEIKSGATLHRSAFTGLTRWCELAGTEASQPKLIYAGDEAREQSGVAVYPWSSISQVLR